MSASRFAAQLRLARITDEFYDAYTLHMSKLSAREQALAVSLLGPDSNAGRGLDTFGHPLSREQLAEAVEGMTDEQRNVLAATVAGSP